MFGPDCVLTISAPRYELNLPRPLFFSESWWEVLDTLLPTWSNVSFLTNLLKSDQVAIHSSERNLIEFWFHHPFTSRLINAIKSGCEINQINGQTKTRKLIVRCYLPVGSMYVVVNLLACSFGSLEKRVNGSCISEPVIWITLMLTKFKYGLSTIVRLQCMFLSCFHWM